MVIDSLLQTQPMVTIKGKSYLLNVKEYESFIEQCDQFMCADNDGLETMVQIVTDQLIDSADANTTVNELRPQLKFMREVAFLLKNLIRPLDAEDLEKS
jgi:hypothetical protein